MKLTETLPNDQPAIMPGGHENYTAAGADTRFAVSAISKAEWN